MFTNTCGRYKWDKKKKKDKKTEKNEYYHKIFFCNLI